MKNMGLVLGIGLGMAGATYLFTNKATKKKMNNLVNSMSNMTKSN